jgi:hypothetical protein
MTPNDANEFFWRHHLQGSFFLTSGELMTRMTPKSPIFLKSSPLSPFSFFEVFLQRGNFGVIGVIDPAKAL